MYQNIYEQVASAVTASSAFVISFPVLNFDGGAVQVVWTAHNGGNATFHLAGSANGSDYSTLTASPNASNTSVITLTSGSSNQLYNVKYAGFYAMRGVYNPGSNDSGTIDVWISRKSNR